MMSMISATDREVVITRLINASAERVYQAWTDPEQVRQWWGPDGFTLTTHEMDVKPGGVWRFIMHGPDGVDFPNTINFKEIVEAEKLVYLHSGDENVENNIRFDVTVIFKEVEGKTELTMKMVFETAEALKEVIEKYNALEGGKQHVKRLEEYLARAD
ncbi:MAG TPA: SRPBCC family protein [bacterium]|jgi:uncharacterized protein YndB with AHSA1/START domain